jgi:hypothetical protein
MAAVPANPPRKICLVTRRALVFLVVMARASTRRASAATMVWFLGWPRPGGGRLAIDSAAQRDLRTARITYRVLQRGSATNMAVLVETMI